MRHLLLLITLLPLMANAQFTANMMRMQQRDATNSFFLSRDLLPPASAADGLFIFSGSTQLPQYALIGSGLSFSGGTLMATGPGSTAWASITGTPTTLAGYGIADAYPLSGNPSGFLTGITSSDIATALGFTPYSNGNPSAYITASALSPYLTSVAAASAYQPLDTDLTAIAALTTTSFGRSVLTQADAAAVRLLIGAGTSSSSGTVTSVTAGAGLSGGVITTTGTVGMPNTGTAGTYSGVTTDAQGRVTAGTTLSINDAPGRSLVTSTSATGFQISATRNARACYEGSFSTTSSIGGPAAASVFLETADTNSTTPGDWTTKARQTYSNTITLAIVLNQVQGNNWSLCRDIPAGKYVRIRSGSISGTAAASINAEQQETTL